jgi:hypothetical protein
MMNTEVFYLIFLKIQDCLSFLDYIRQIWVKTRMQIEKKNKPFCSVFFCGYKIKSYKGTENGIDQKLQILRNNSSVFWNNGKEGCIFFNLFLKGY